MLNVQNLQKTIAQYKKDFSQHWLDEKYKWEAIKHFQDNWNINTPDFYAMFEKATAKTQNLLTSYMFFAKGMMLEFIKLEPETTREMFKKLFDEEQPLAQRITDFINSSDVLKEKNPKWKNHYQNANAVSTYLWLMYPDKYYICKYSECKSVIDLFDIDIDFKKGKASNNILSCMDLYNEICGELSKDKELVELLHSLLTSDCYPDPLFRTLTMDFCFWCSRDYNKKYTPQHIIADDKEKANISSENIRYWWLNANPKIWQFNNIAIGEEQTYTLYNDNHNKRRIFQNFLDAKPGDIIVGYESTPVKQIVALGVVSKEHDDENFYFKKTEQLTVPIDYQDLLHLPELENMEYLKNAQGSLFSLTPEEYNVLIDIIRDSNPVNSEKEEYPSYTEKDFLSEVFMTESDLKTLKGLLSRKKNLILQGAPGVGKTFSAKRLAYAILGRKDDAHIERIQFHQNYSYEDFIMGYKPQENGFKLEYGVFYQFCTKAANNPHEPYFFIIDEINRGNMSKIFGELLMLIEKDYRGPDNSILMAYNKTSFNVPDNLYIIGMMNTADRSLAMIDYALRRRFCFYTIKPGFETEGFKKYQKSLKNTLLDNVIEKIKDLNAEIVVDTSLGEGFCIGHSYFCGKDEEYTSDILYSIVFYEIIPMLEEYWFDDSQKLEKWKGIFKDIFK